MTLDQYIDAHGDDNCEGCPHYHAWTELHPYGMTTAAEELWSCQAGEGDTCQGIEKLMEDSQ